MKKERKTKPRKQNTCPTLADRADKHELYETAVQCTEAEIDFVDATFKKLRKRQPVVIREDFCGTANTSCEWVRRRAKNRAIGVDLDTEVQQWGREHHIAKLNTDQQKRIELVHADVMEVTTEPVDAVLAMNFSYWIFKDRPTMVRYFRRVHATLADDGILFMDSFGGYESFKEMKESRSYKGFKYIWHQSKYNPVTGDYCCKIHFKFKDGSKIKNAFVYDWRLWTLPELTEMLTEAGFKPTVYWEGSDENGEGDGVFTPTTLGEADAGWIAYIVAEK